MCGSDQAGGEYVTPASLKPVPKDQERGTKPTFSTCFNGFREAKAGDLVLEDFPITFEGYSYPYGRLAYIKGRPPAPVILVHHNYAGLKQFDVDQACFIARAGYVGLAVDLYQETATFSAYDRGRNFGRPLQRDAFGAMIKAEQLMEQQQPGGSPCGCGSRRSVTVLCASLLVYILSSDSYKVYRPHVREDEEREGRGSVSKTP